MQLRSVIGVSLLSLVLPLAVAAAPPPPDCLEVAGGVEGMVVPDRRPAGLTVVLGIGGSPTPWADHAPLLARRDRGLVLVSDADLQIADVEAVVAACEVDRVAVISEGSTGSVALALSATGIVDAWFALDPSFDVAQGAFDADLEGLAGLVTFAGPNDQLASKTLGSAVFGRGVPVEAYVTTMVGAGEPTPYAGELTPLARLETWWQGTEVSCAVGVADDRADLALRPGCVG